MRAVVVAILVLLAASAASAAEAPVVALDMPPGTPAPPSANPCHPVILTLDRTGAAFLTLDRTGGAFVGERPVARSQLGKTVADLTKTSNNCERVFIRPDPDTPYGEVLMVISLLKQAGIFRIALIDTAYER